MGKERGKFTSILTKRENFYAWICMGGRGLMGVFRSKERIMSIGFSGRGELTHEAMDRLQAALQAIIAEDITFSYMTY